MRKTGASASSAGTFHAGRTAHASRTASHAARSLRSGAVGERPSQERSRGNDERTRENNGDSSSNVDNHCAKILANPTAHSAADVRRCESL